jgi:hypothetical protein
MKTFLYLSAMILLSYQTKLAQAYTYQWVDQNGTIHFTDNPQELPEPYRSKAIQELIDKRKQNQQKTNPKPYEDSERLPDVSNERLPVTPTEIPSVTSTSSSSNKNSEVREIDKETEKKLWKEKLIHAQKKATDLADLCDSLRLELGKATNAKAIYGRSSDLARAEKIDADLKRCEQDLEKARLYLEEGLFDEARRKGIPPGWLR